MRPSSALMRVGGVLGVVLLVVIAADMIWGGDPSLSAVLLFWALALTLTEQIVSLTSLISLCSA